jgi:hypothetical protein
MLKQISWSGVENSLQVLCLPRPTEIKKKIVFLFVQFLPQSTRLNKSFLQLQKIILLRGASQSALYCTVLYRVFNAIFFRHHGNRFTPPCTLVHLICSMAAPVIYLLAPQRQPQ